MPIAVYHCNGCRGFLRVVQLDCDIEMTLSGKHALYRYVAPVLPPYIPPLLPCHRFGHVYHIVYQNGPHGATSVRLLGSHAVRPGPLPLTVCVTRWQREITDTLGAVMGGKNANKALTQLSVRQYSTFWPTPRSRLCLHCRA